MKQKSLVNASILLCIPLFWLFFSGCGPVLYTSKIIEATDAIQKAKVEKSWKLSCYEYYSALHYFKKAKEEAGFSDFEVAASYAERSSTFASKAFNQSKKRSTMRRDPPVKCLSPYRIYKEYRKKNAPSKIETARKIVE